MSTATAERLRNFIGGRWVASSVYQVTPVHNPSRGDLIAEVPKDDPESTFLAIAAAKNALADWSATPPAVRARVFFNLRNQIHDHFDELALLVSREHGKTLAESRGDVQRGLEMVEFAAGIPALLQGESLRGVARGIDCDVAREPVGVCVGITPYNFPAMVPLWMWPLSIACGNAFVLKPSEKTPLTSMRLTDMLIASGLPDGVFNLVHGGRQTVQTLLTNDDVAAVSFVGSTPVARTIYETASKHGKRVQSAGGAKNFVVVMPDTEVQPTISGIKDAAFGCAGQRCMAGSTLIVVGEAKDRVLPELVALVASMKVGPTDSVDHQPDMGAVVSHSHRERVLGLLDRGIAEGGRMMLDGRDVQVDDAGDGFYIAPTIVGDLTLSNTLIRDEVFGPVLGVMNAESLDQALAIAGSSGYGNGASIFTSSGRTANEFRTRVQAGMVGINVGVPATLAYFPFSGWGNSFFGDLHMQGREGILFFTRAKTTTQRWFAADEGDIWRK